MLLKDGDQINRKEYYKMIKDSFTGLAAGNVKPENMIPVDLHKNCLWLKHFPNRHDEIAEHSLRKVFTHIRSRKKENAKRKTYVKKPLKVQSSQV